MSIIARLRYVKGNIRELTHTKEMDVRTSDSFASFGVEIGHS